MTCMIRRECLALIVLLLALTFSGCATTNRNLRPEEPAMHTIAEFSDDEPVVRVDDPWEGFNRSMYRFNYRFDKYVFLPVVKGYEFITPDLVQTGVSNFFSNIGEFRTFYNSLLQAKGTKALTTLGRFVTNTTIGIGGLFDPATHWGLEKQREDFGQTLGAWGVSSGPYLVLPILGPNTARGAGGFAVDGGIRIGVLTAIDPFENVDNGDAIQAGISTLEAIDLRHREKFRYYDSGHPFEYELVRFLSSKRLELGEMK